jgi:small-conductance mechanosensitive channel
MPQPERTGAVRACLLAAAAILLAVSCAAAQTIAPTDPEARDVRPSPVLIEGDPILWITAGAGPYTTQYRAERITQRIMEVVHDRSIRDPSVTVTEVDGSTELRSGSRMLMVVTAADAASLGASRASIALQHARVIEQAIRSERLRYAPSALLKSGIYGFVATLIFAAIVWIILRVTGVLRRRVEGRQSAASTALGVLHEEVLQDTRMAHATRSIVVLVRIVLILIAFDLYLTFVLGLFPWTRAVSRKLLGYAYAPVAAVARAFVGYLPKLLFVVVIVAIVYAAMRLVDAFFRSIRDGRLVFPNFPAEWADPTARIVRMLMASFGLVVAFPYLPASDSPAFAGVSVFIGVLVSLASSSALSNMIAGIVLTYTSAFRLGDRVKLGDAFGDVIDSSLLATRVRTIKNEIVIIPNSLALGSAVTNYTREAATRGLILHTTVTIGYDAPWRTVHDLLIEAALGTPGVLAEPRPFVWQTSLNDFYVSYEINAYTASPAEMIDIYAALHARIQDTFYAAGVEIMSPHFTAVRDGNTIAIPEAFRPSGYRPPPWRVETEPAPRASRATPGAARPVARPGHTRTPGNA